VIGRIWRGWTKTENADKYEELLKEEIFPSIAEKQVSGYKGIKLFRRPIDNDEVKQFAGGDYERAYVPPAAREVLERFEELSRHYEIREHLEY
jgi:hypothetical protein